MTQACFARNARARARIADKRGPLKNDENASCFAGKLAFVGIMPRLS